MELLKQNDMTIIKFFKSVFIFTKGTPQDLSAPSLTDIATKKELLFPTKEQEITDIASAPNTETSLLDNNAYMSLAGNCCDIVKELDKLKAEDNQDLINLVISHIKEGLISSGAKPIAEETEYDVIRHTAVGKSIVRKGTPIISTLDPGIAIGDKVMIKAKVQI